ncbi:MAG TPA: hypothetical protein VJO99_09220, partial [Burkholderiaceae bacterium]|nr:hypothetical protein [Burkholderiaceae bacterium]
MRLATVVLNSRSMPARIRSLTSGMPSVEDGSLDFAASIGAHLRPVAPQPVAHFSSLSMTRTRRRLVIGASLLLALALLVFIALQIAVRQLRAQIETALGPRASIGAIEAGWSGLAVIDLRIKAAAGWPADDELRARRVHVQPDLRSLFGGPWRIATIRVEDGYVSALRTR